MLKNANTFHSFSTNDLNASKNFYGKILGLDVVENQMGILEIQAGDSNTFIIYPKGTAHQPAHFTVLNFEVEDIEETVEQLKSSGVTFEQYGEPIKTDEKGICRGSSGPAIAWFKDPAGNILSLLEKK